MFECHEFSFTKRKCSRYLTRVDNFLSICEKIFGENNFDDLESEINSLPDDLKKIEIEKMYKDMIKLKQIFKDENI